MEKLTMHTQDMAEANIEKIGQLFPNCLTERLNEKGQPETAIDFDKLKQELSKEIVEGNQERYQFTWPGKREAMRLANTPTNMTLRPCREDSVDFDNTENLYIEGDNLEVLKLLRENYLGKVKMIYIDPPYNTGNDFVYEDDFSQTAGEFKDKSGMFDENGKMLLQNYEVNADSNGRFHTDWLNMIYPRLKVARDLLKENGAIFISIDDNEMRNMRSICDELFGSSNFCGTIIWKKKTNGNNMGVIPPVHDYILVYAKCMSSVYEIGYENTDISGYCNPDNDPRGLWTTMDLSANHKGPYFGITNPKTGEIFYPSEGRYWVFNEKDVKKRISEGRIIFGKTGNSRPVQRVFLSERGLPKRKVESWWDDKGMNEDATAELKDLFGISKVFSHPKPTELIYNICSIILEKNDIVMDFFSGSATSAHAIMEFNSHDGMKRPFIMIQLPENLDENLKIADSAMKAYAENSIAFLDSIGKPHIITEIGKERIRRAGKKILQEQQSKKKETGLFSSTEPEHKLDIGFRVLKLDTSNMQDVYYTPEASSQTTLFDDNVKPDRTPEDLLFQVMLECNLPLSAKIETKKISGKEVFNVNDGYLIACFDEDVNESVITEVAKQKPYYFIMRDKSLSSDQVADNFEQIFNAYSKDTIRRIL